MESITVAKFGTGAAAARIEDRRLLTGRGRYTDDIRLPGEARAVVLRSPHAHARIRSIDISAAAEAPGVLAVLTDADWSTDGLGLLPCRIAAVVPLKRPDGAPMFEPPRPPLARSAVKFVGDAVAFVVAETALQARDAAELIEVDYEELPAVTDTAAALAEGAPAAWADCPDNISYRHTLGDAAAVDAAFAAAAHVTRVEIPVTRLVMNPMEPRAAIGAYDEAEGRYILYSGNQNPHDLRRCIAEAVLCVPESTVRVVSPDMGGSFGLRGSLFPEQVLVMWAAKRVGRPVKWVGDRTEAHLADDQGRDSRLTVELALDAEARFTGVRVRSLAALGAYLSFFGPLPTFSNMPTVVGVYTIPTAFVEIIGVMSNTPATAPYRGAGRPESTLMIETAIDRAARELGIDRIELRRRNMIPPEAMPYRTGLTATYDCGRFEEGLDKALANADFGSFPARRAEAEARGRLRGIGVVCSIEQSAAAFDEGAELRFESDGSATLKVGTHSHGQGHETVYRQILADRLGLAPERVRFVQGDTDRVPHGHGTFGSRSAALAGSAILGAADRIVEKGRRIAAHHFETAVEDIAFEEGGFAVAGTDRRLSLADVARLSFQARLLPPGEDAGLGAFATFPAPGPNFPNGTHICEVEIDRETGVMTFERYVVVDDVGTVLNPLLLKGQIHGGVVQGLGQALYEAVSWDPETAQPVTGSFMDYAMPRASDMPAVEVESNPVPTAHNPLGVKGAGEAGTVGALPAAMLAVLDALAPLGVDRFDMPATPERLWRAIHSAPGARAMDGARAG